MGFKSLTCSSVLTITHLVCINHVSADFCEFMICHPAEQYCCGDNKCCNYNNYSTWYLWGVAVLIGLLLVALYYIVRNWSNSYRDRDPECDKAPIVNR